jgi:hypothetical protein
MHRPRYRRKLHWNQGDTKRGDRVPDRRQAVLAQRVLITIATRDPGRLIRPLVSKVRTTRNDFDLTVGTEVRIGTMSSGLPQAICRPDPGRPAFSRPPLWLKIEPIAPRSGLLERLCRAQVYAMCRWHIARRKRSMRDDKTDKVRAWFEQVDGQLIALVCGKTFETRLICRR